MNTWARNIQNRLAGLRPRWAWVLLALGLPWLLTPLSCEGSASGCLAFLLATSFWIAALVFLFLGLRWLWRKALFRVSRRLWVILSLLSAIPAVGLSIIFLAISWMALGGQANHLMVSELKVLTQGLKMASQEESDLDALAQARRLGPARMKYLKELPKGMQPGYVGLTAEWYEGAERPELALVALTRQGRNYRMVSVDIERLRERALSVWEGPVHYQLKALGKPPETRSWVLGRPLGGSFLFTPFTLPPIGLTVLEPRTGRLMALNITPETSLPALFRGYGLSERLKGISRPDAYRQVWPVAGLLFLLAVLQFSAMVLGFLLTTGLGSAVNQLYGGVQRLAAGDFKARLRPRGQDQVARLTEAFNTLAFRLDKAEDERRERLRLEEELRVAREVQMRLLPDVSCLTSCIRATILPAREVAGDYFDVLPLRDGRFAFLIADVSGKGTSAAFYAAETKGVLAALDKEALGPQEVLARLNTIWRASNPRSLFMTAIYGTYNPATGDFAFVRAGHPPAFLRRQEGGVVRLSPRGLGIGLASNPALEAWTIQEGQLEPGDALLFCTDGLTEAMDPENALFGEERIETALAEPYPDLTVHLLAAVEAFTQGRPLEDDLTLLVLSRE